VDKSSLIYMATASFGQGITATPLQMVSSYAAIANGGKLMKPYIVQSVEMADGEVLAASPRDLRQVISSRAATLLSGMLVSVVQDGHAKSAGVPGYHIAGKTGTAQVPDLEKGGYSDATIHTFVGFGPVRDPQFAMLVRLDDPKDVRFSASSAAPLFGQIAKFLLNYLEVEPDYDL
jgi:cell division protein FtsI/penicillin-binding protein 2